jgi:hypothetical protein
MYANHQPSCQWVADRLKQRGTVQVLKLCEATSRLGLRFLAQLARVPIEKEPVPAIEAVSLSFDPLTPDREQLGIATAFGLIEGQMVGASDGMHEPGCDVLDHVASVHIFFFAGASEGAAGATEAVRRALAGESDGTVIQKLART